MMLTLLAGVSFASTESAPRRVVSLNLCVDAVLVEIAPREQIAALSHLSLDPERSVIADIAQTFPVTYETAEEVVLLQPDLVIATRHSALATRNALKRVGVRVMVLGVPDSVRESLDQIREIAAAIGRVSSGNALVARIEAELAAARAPDPRMYTALILQPGGMSPAANTLPGELMRIVGLTNIAARYGVDHWGRVLLENVVADPPEVLLLGHVSPGAPTWSERLIQHPALDYVARHRASSDAQHFSRAEFPARLLYCGGPVMLPALRTLVSARRAAAELRR